MPPFIGFNNQQTAPTCKIDFIDVAAPPGNTVLPPNYVPDPIFPPVGSLNPYDVPDDACIPHGEPIDPNSPIPAYNGYTNDGLMRPCRVNP